MMRVFSSRRETITAGLRERARAFEQQRGRAPSQRELAHLAQAANFATRAPKTKGAPDSDALYQEWAARLAAALGVQLASVAPSVWGETSPPGPAANGFDGPPPRQASRELTQAAGQALTRAQGERSTWTRADFLEHLARVLPRTGRNPAAAARLLEELAGKAVAGEYGPVVCLDAPEPVELPRDLIRADGRSVPPSSTADFAWVEHMVSSMKPDTGRVGVVTRLYRAQR
jgi:hypothetical protein